MACYDDSCLGICAYQVTHGHEHLLLYHLVSFHPPYVDLGPWYVLVGSEQDLKIDCPVLDVNAIRSSEGDADLPVGWRVAYVSVDISAWVFEPSDVDDSRQIIASCTTVPNIY